MRLLIALLAAASIPATATSAVGPGDLLARSDTCGGAGGALIQVDAATGNRTVVSGRDENCALVGSGPELVGDPDGLAVSQDGRIFAKGPSERAIVEVTL